MDMLINFVVEKTGLSQDQAASAVNAVVGFIKDKLPEGMQGMVDSVIGGGGSGDSAGGGDIMGQATSMLGGMFGGDDNK